MSAPRTYYLVPTRVQPRVMLAQTRVLGAPSVPVPVVQSRQPRPVQTHCLKRPAPSVSVEDDEDDPLESLLNGGSGQGPPRKRERLNHLTAEQKLDRRKLKNRVAAQTARDRKKARSQRLEEVVRQLMDENARLREENSRLRVIEQQKILEPAVESAAFISGPLPRVQAASILLSLIQLLHLTSSHKTRSTDSSRTSRTTSTLTNSPVSFRSTRVPKSKKISLYRNPHSLRRKWDVP